MRKGDRFTVTADVSIRTFKNKPADRRPFDKGAREIRKIDRAFEATRNEGLTPAAYAAAWAAKAIEPGLEPYTGEGFGSVVYVRAGDVLEVVCTRNAAGKRPGLVVLRHVAPIPAETFGVIHTASTGAVDALYLFKTDPRLKRVTGAELEGVR